MAADTVGASVSTGRRVAALLALAAVPWSVQTVPGRAVTLLFPWGLVTLDPPGATTLYHFLFVHTAGLPAYVLAWPLSVGLYLLALASGTAGLVAGREDARVTGGLLVLAGIAQLSVASGFSFQPSRTAYPLGTAALWLVAWRYYWPAVRDRRHPPPRPDGGPGRGDPGQDDPG